MSLRQFHILFVTIVTCLFLGLGGWALMGYFHNEGGSLLWFGAGSLAVALIVVAYGIWFLRKTRRMGLIE
ncbi:hypothetical protein MAMC_00937 [Methylacidimicrobium cyclopophantes]|uniref:Uncharacterized protein n=1 Tax=Methylacidimicrobium cyclopophantes TaxID=1041766 RepID=A0A5E6M9L3_9BACT|nr:hypothetical protein [Methylacidimicrobium cyclopophantes]VVM06084.1 hypothetical protein MAMC_00937 [Methylacidimicrobium cyclopophantes]